MEQQQHGELAKESDDGNINPALESKRYRFLVNGTMPVLDFQITTGSREAKDEKKQRLILELYNPLASEVFEAKFDTGRVEVDIDGSITYFTTKIDHVNFSLFLGRYLSISMKKSGEVLIKTPSTIKSIEKKIKSKNHRKKEEATYDSLKLQLE